MSSIYFDGIGNGTVSNALNGLHLDGTTAELGGALIENTTVSAGAFNVHLTGVPEVGKTAQFCVSRDLFGLGIPGIGAQFNISATEWYFYKVSNDTSLGGSYTAAIGYINTVSGAETFLDCTSTELHLFVTSNGVAYTGVGVTNTTTAIQVADVVKATFVNNLTTLASNLKYTDYPNTRNDTGTFTPTSLFYPGANGEVYVAPLATLATSGTYTPTLTNVTNISASTAYQCQWLRVGNVVTVSGKIDIDVTIAAASELGVSLPVASNIGAEENLGGTASSPAAASLVGAIRGDAANNRAAVVFVAVSVTNDSYFFEFTYLII